MIEMALPDCVCSVKKLSTVITLGFDSRPSRPTPNESCHTIEKITTSSLMSGAGRAVVFECAYTRKHERYNLSKRPELVE
jgi:hypothetical protein